MAYQVALITGDGASGGIGMACARALGAAGYSLAITATTRRIEARRADLMAQGSSVTAHIGDLPDSIPVSRVYDKVGPVCVLVNNAGMGSVPAATGASYARGVVLVVDGGNTLQERKA